MKKILMLIAIMTLLMTGCATTRTIVDDSQPGQSGQDRSETSEALDSAGQPISDDIDITDSSRSLADIAAQYRTAPNGTPDFGDIFFEYDSYSIGSAGRNLISDMATWIINNNAILLIEGHCDERGTREYNIALGDRRALSVKDYLLASGVPDLKIETVSYGKERPQCRESEESCWRTNRRAHFIMEVIN